MKKGLVQVSLVLVLLWMSAAVCFADNPVIGNTFTADPAAMVYNNRVYLYTGHDEADVNGTGYVMKDWKVYSSTDMVNWTDHGTPLSVSAFSWAKGDAWASQVIERNGKFYWYICAEHKTIPGKAIGVAISDSPTGPFRDALGRALITNDMTKFSSSYWDDIDPAVFIDDDGQAYLYWGNSVLMYAKLNSDMVSISGSITSVSLPNFTEAPWLHKRNGIYYLSYASGWPESISYATSQSPTGPWTYRGVIMEPTAHSGTNHQAIIEFKGQAYFIYHNGALPTGGDYRRSVAIEKFNYNSDGTIPTLQPTSTGVNGTMNRIQSYNFPNMYVRHQNYDARIDENVSPSTDQYWQIVPGLANNGTDYVSIKSVYFPGYYLRHNSFDFVLEKDNGTTQFKADATFKKVAGLKNSSWTSLQSYNYPTMYIRHIGYELKLQTISTDQDKQDATFRLVN
ncbi:1,4-beta-xylanase [Paenibacillus oralis]|uniref:1,4-beta-xylanase n=1 Tax=Paenibacillus oralis TaxID=2490856 RepID=A0A3P3U6H3_9BACL|nr:family 43 glycosylhydrolase [Paenibacillus oralis]RRJ65754.1 1,4-beta-xylanase [Paenibacillus oralis]